MPMGSSAETRQSNDLTKIGSASPEQQPLPEIWDENGDPHPAWSVDAEPEEYEQAAAYMVAAVEPSASEGRMQTISRLLKTRDYSRAELLLAMKRLPFDPDASHNYGRGFNPADVERIVSEHRTLRAKLGQPLSSDDRDELIAEFPDKIDPDAFHCCGFNSYDEPQWMYAPGAEAEPKEPNPDLGESLPGASRQESDTDGETATLGEILDEAQQHDTE
jgi:hypothetical protein